MTQYNLVIERTFEESKRVGKIPSSSFLFWVRVIDSSDSSLESPQVVRGAVRAHNTAAGGEDVPTE